MGNWPDHEVILARFRDWLDEARTESESLEGQDFEPPPADPVGFCQLIEQFTALRQDVKLLAKTARGTEERNEATLLSLGAAIEQFRAVQAKEEEAADKAARPLVEAFVELEESLVRGRRAICQARQRILEDVSAGLTEAARRLDDLYRTQPWWRRILCRPWHNTAKAIYAGGTLDTYRNIFDALLEGYDLIQDRTHRAMRQLSIARMECLDKPADPNRMTVVEVVSDVTRRPGTVVEEIRPGYCWQGRVVRFAEVKAVGEQ